MQEKPRYDYHKYFRKNKKASSLLSYGYLIGFNVGLEQRSGLLPTDWESSQRMIQMHAMTSLIRHGGDPTELYIPKMYHYSF